MPLLRLLTSDPVPPEKREAVLADLSRLVAQAIGKPESYVMVTLEAGDVMMAGEAGRAAFVDVRSIGGLGRDTNRVIAKGVSDLVGEATGVPADRIYLNFTDVPRTDWGYNGSTFG